MFLTFRQGLNTKKGFDVKVAAEITKLTGLEFKTAPNKVSPCIAVLCLITHVVFSSKLLRLMTPLSRHTAP